MLANLSAFEKGPDCFFQDIFGVLGEGEELRELARWSVVRGAAELCAESSHDFSNCSKSLNTWSPTCNYYYYYYNYLDA